MLFRMISSGLDAIAPRPFEGRRGAILGSYNQTLEKDLSSSGPFRQREHKQGATQSCVLGEVFVTADSTQACG
jgi:hypothetical protein